MADLTITAASVVQGSGAKTETGIAGEAITAGQTLAENAAGAIVLSDSNSATPALRTVVGISLHAAASGQPITYVKKGPVTIGATVAASVPYFASATAGGICPAADVATGHYATFLGFGISTTQIYVDLVEAGVVKA